MVALDGSRTRRVVWQPGCNSICNRAALHPFSTPGLHPNAAAALGTPGLAALLLPVDRAHRRCRCDVEWHHGLVRLTARGVSGIFSHRQTMGEHVPPDLLPGTLDLLILKALAANPQHGYGIAQRLRTVSDDVLQVGESSLYPALQRLLLKGWVKAEWGASENNRRARFYTLTAAGRKQLAVERQEFERLILAIHKVLNTA